MHNYWVCGCALNNEFYCTIHLKVARHAALDYQKRPGQSTQPKTCPYMVTQTGEETYTLTHAALFRIHRHGSASVRVVCCHFWSRSSSELCSSRHFMYSFSVNLPPKGCTMTAASILPWCRCAFLPFADERQTGTCYRRFIRVDIFELYKRGSQEYR
jgi:hypothetical protein